MALARTRSSSSVSSALSMRAWRTLRVGFGAELAQLAGEGVAAEGDGGLAAYVGVFVLSRRSMSTGMRSRRSYSMRPRRRGGTDGSFVVGEGDLERRRRS